MNMLQHVDPIVVENLLLGACPERELEIRESWKTFRPEFYLVADGVGALLSAYDNRVTWMHKTFALDWAIASIGMRSLVAYSPYVLLGTTSNAPITLDDFAQDDELTAIESQVDEVLYFTRQLRHCGAEEQLEWPSSIPSPGSCPDASLDPTGKAIFDLACMAAAASFFHELRHLQFSAESDAPIISSEEEHACDEHARRMLIDRIGDYCSKTGEAYSQVLDKRIMALATVALCIAHQEPVGMEAAIAGTHPPLMKRFQTLVLNSSADENAHAWMYTGCVLVHLLRTKNKLPEKLAFTSARDLCAQLVDLL